MNLIKYLFTRKNKLYKYNKYIYLDYERKLLNFIFFLNFFDKRMIKTLLSTIPFINIPT